MSDAAPETRFSEILTDLNNALKEAGAVVCAELKDVFEEAAAAAVTKDGKPDGRELSLTALVAGFPRELALEAKAFAKRTEQEIRYRGEEWHRVGLLPALREYLTALA